MPSEERTDQGFIAPYSEATRLDSLPGHRNDAVLRFDRYWQGLVDRNGRWPTRQDIDPVALGAEVLPWILLIDVLSDDAGIYFRYRLCGTGIAELVGRDVTGTTTREVIREDNLKIITDPYLATLNEKRPSFWSTSVLHDNFGWRPVVRGIWPCANEGQNIDMLINLTVPVDAEGFETE